MPSAPMTPAMTTSMVEPGTRGQMLCPDPCTSQTATRWELLHNLSPGRQSAHQHLKRRNDSSDEELDDELRTTPVKQHISEDKVSAIFDKLHITNGHSFDTTIEAEELEEDSSDQSHHKSMVFTDELQSAIKCKTMTERVVQNELDKLSKAVVLWQPPTPILSVGLTPDAHHNQQSDDPNESGSDTIESETTADNADSAPRDCDLDIDYMIEEVLDCDHDYNDMEL